MNCRAMYASALNGQAMRRLGEASHVAVPVSIPPASTHCPCAIEEPQARNLHTFPGRLVGLVLELDSEINAASHAAESLRSTLACDLLQRVSDPDN